jgi:hypothetical protein
MPTDSRTFAIDDTLGTSDNLAAYVRLLAAMDGSLGAALSPFLTSLAAGQPVDTGAVWDALYAATADPDPVAQGDGAANVEGAT